MRNVIHFDMFKLVASGEVAGSLTAAQMPNIPVAGAVLIQASPTNVGNVYIGGPGVTKPDGSTDTTTGIGLAAGEVLQAMPVDNLNRYYFISDNVGDDVLYMIWE